MMFDSFIYTDTRSEVVLTVKESRKSDYMLEVPGVTVHRLVSPRRFPRLHGFAQTFDPLTGLRKSGELDPAEHSRLVLSRQKIEILIFVKTALVMLKRDLTKNLGSRALTEIPMSDSAFRVYWKFMRNERKYHRLKMNQYFASVQASVGQAATLEELEKLFCAMKARSFGLITTSEEGIANATARD